MTARDKALKANVEKLWELYHSARDGGNVVDAPWGFAEPKRRVEDATVEAFDRETGVSKTEIDVECLIGSNEAVVRVGVVGAPSPDLSRSMAGVCKCGAGQARREYAGRGTWVGMRCDVGTYVGDLNSPTHSCETDVGNAPAEDTSGSPPDDAAGKDALIVPDVVDAQEPGARQCSCIGTARDHRKSWQARFGRCFCCPAGGEAVGGGKTKSKPFKGLRRKLSALRNAFSRGPW